MAEELSFQGDGSDAYGGKLRIPPQNIEAEEAVLGGILLDPEAISRVSDRLLPEAFYITLIKISIKQRCASTLKVNPQTYSRLQVG